MKRALLSALILAVAIPLSAFAAEMNSTTAHPKKGSAVVAQANPKGSKHAKKSKKAKTPKIGESKIKS